MSKIVDLASKKKELAGKTNNVVELKKENPSYFDYVLKANAAKKEKQEEERKKKNNSVLHSLRIKD